MLKITNTETGTTTDVTIRNKDTMMVFENEVNIPLRFIKRSINREIDYELLFTLITFEDVSTSFHEKSLISMKVNIHNAEEGCALKYEKKFNKIINDLRKTHEDFLKFKLFLKYNAD